MNFLKLSPRLRPKKQTFVAVAIVMRNVFHLFPDKASNKNIQLGIQLRICREIFLCDGHFIKYVNDRKSHCSKTILVDKCKIKNFHPLLFRTSSVEPLL